MKTGGRDGTGGCLEAIACLWGEGWWGEGARVGVFSDDDTLTTLCVMERPPPDPWPPALVPFRSARCYCRAGSHRAFPFPCLAAGSRRIVYLVLERDSFVHIYLVVMQTVFT